MAENVWIVSTGCYSDYSVVDVFASEAAAQAFVAAIQAANSSGYDDYRVEDGYVLYDAPPEVHTRYCMSAYVNRDGSLSGEYARSEAKWNQHTCRVEVKQSDSYTDAGPALFVFAEGCRKDEVEKALRDRVEAYQTILI